MVCRGRVDEEGEVDWSVTCGKCLDKIIVGSHAENYVDWLILSHYKGHQMMGLAGNQEHELEFLPPAESC